jgi:hypothetical protein
MKIGKAVPVDLRELWKKESANFTSWLAEHLDYLTEELGFELTLVSREKKVDSSRFTIDIWAHDEEGNSVIIENQLEETDHRHLGQIITYVSNMSAKKVIWITPSPRQEHINAINWLNEFTDTEFYIVELSAIRIGGSDPAPVFSLISKPDESVRQYGDEQKAFTEVKRSHQQRKERADTIVVPAKKEGFDRVFLNENQWYSVRIGEDIRPRLKFIACYQVSPVSAITHVAEIKEILPSEFEPGKWRIRFKGASSEIKPIPIGTAHIQGPIYCEKSVLDRAKTVADLLEG